ncbi:MAG: response regulator transcription factor [Rhodospirillaceae bacterium]
MAKILLVEDDKFISSVVSRMLTDGGHSVVHAVDGLDSVAKTLSDRPDLIIMDLGLPSMNGWDATKTLKSDPKTSEIPILALTANMTAEDREDAYNAGCDAFLTKPAAADVLLGRIAELLKG